MYFVYRSFFDCGRTFFNCEPLHSDLDEPKLGTMFAVYPDDRLSLGETKIAPAMISESGLYYSIECNFSFPLPALVTNVANIRVVYRGPVRIQDEATLLRHRLGHAGWCAAAMRFGNELGVLIEGEKSSLVDNMALIYGSTSGSLPSTIDASDIDNRDDILARFSVR